MCSPIARQSGTPPGGPATGRHNILEKTLPPDSLPTRLQAHPSMRNARRQVRARVSRPLRSEHFHRLRLSALVLRSIHRRYLIVVNLARFHLPVAIARRRVDVGDLLEFAVAHGTIETIPGHVGLRVPFPNKLETLRGDNSAQPLGNGRGAMGSRRAGGGGPS